MHKMAYVNAACTGRVTIFSTGGKFRPVSNFTQLHALTLAARSYALLSQLPSMFRFAFLFPQIKQALHAALQPIFWVETVRLSSSYLIM